MELSERISQAASAQGILASALEDAVSRGTQRFLVPPTDQELSDWAQSLRATAPHFFPPAAAPAAADVPAGVPASVWRSLSPSSKLAWAREHGHGLPPVPRRPPPLTLTAEQIAELAALPPAQRLAAYRALQEGLLGPEGKG